MTDFHRLADAYHRHHFMCQTCISAGQGRGWRCPTGQALWQAYQTGPGLADWLRPKDRTRPNTDRPKTDHRPNKTEPEPDSQPTERPEMIVTDSGGEAFTPCPAGSYLARCVQLIDLGTQTSNFEGKTKHARKVLIAWEVLDDECRRDDGKPYVLKKRFTQSLHEKAGLRKALASWRGRDFTLEELKGFDLVAVLGRDCYLSVIHTEKDGRTFADVAAIMRCPKGMTVPPGASSEPLQQWDMAAPDWAVFATLSPRLIEQIESSPEYKTLKAPKAVQLGASDPAGGSGFDDLPDTDVDF